MGNDSRRVYAEKWKKGIALVRTRHAVSQHHHDGRLELFLSKNISQPDRKKSSRRDNISCRASLILGTLQSSRTLHTFPVQLRF